MKQAHPVQVICRDIFCKRVSLASRSYLKRHAADFQYKFPFQDGMGERFVLTSFLRGRWGGCWWEDLQGVVFWERLPAVNYFVEDSQVWLVNSWYPTDSIIKALFYRASIASANHAQMHSQERKFSQAQTM